MLASYRYLDIGLGRSELSSRKLAGERFYQAVRLLYKTSLPDKRNQEDPDFLKILLDIDIYIKLS